MCDTDTLCIVNLLFWELIKILMNILPCRADITGSKGGSPHCFSEKIRRIVGYKLCSERISLGDSDWSAKFLRTWTSEKTVFWYAFHEKSCGVEKKVPNKLKKI